MPNGYEQEKSEERIRAKRAIESAKEKLEMALSGTSPVSKNTLIKEAIKILKG